MRIPKFVPLVEKTRRSREWSGFFIEVLMWGYAAVVLSRILFAGVFMPYVEDLAYEEPPVAWAQGLVDWTGLDTRYLSFEWSTLGLIFLIGSALGAAIAMTGRGFGTWISSISKLQVTNPEDSLRIERHWSYARKEGAFFLLLTLVTAWVVTRVDLGKLFDAEGGMGAGRLLLQLACGIPGVGATGIGYGETTWVNFHGSLYEVFQWFVNLCVAFFNIFRSLFGWETIPLFDITCVPTPAEYYSTALMKLTESIYLAFIATFFAVPVAFFGSFLAARNLTRHSVVMRTVYVLIRTYMNVTRSIEPMIWAILFSVWIGIGPFAGSIALMVHSIASLVKQYSEAIESVDEGPIEALQATGANRIATAWFSVVPQVVLPFLAFTIYRWDINVRMATIIGLVGGGGIGGLLIQEQGLAHWTGVGTLAFLIFIVVWTMDFLSARVREAIQ